MEQRIILLLRIAASLGVVVLFALLWRQSPPPRSYPSHASSKATQTTEESRGIALGLFASEPDYDYKRAMRRRQSGSKSNNPNQSSGEKGSLAEAEQAHEAPEPPGQ